MQNRNDLIDKIVSLSKRRGFVFQSSEIYGGLNGCWDYGPLGVELLKNIKEQWWRSMTFRNDVEGIDASILMHPKVWEASGHVEHFSDPMVDCKQCKSRYRLDVISDLVPEKKKIKILETLNLRGDFGFLLELEETSKKIIDEINCPQCGNKGTFTSARQFNLMFKTFIGSLEDDSSTVYLRPETAQGIFVNFLNVQSSSRQKIPFGIAQIGKAFRNEINTKNFLFRTREFEQMEMQFFVNPSNDKEWFDYWKADRLNWYLDLGINKNRLKYHDHPKDKLAHYAKEATDIEYEFPFGWGEIEGIHNRTDFDLSRHEEFSGKSLKYFDEESKQKFIPFIIETSGGVSRTFMAFFVDAYNEEDAPTADGKTETRVVLKFNKKLAPIKSSILPLVNKDGMPEIAKNIEADLRKYFKVFYDDKGAIGRRYRRQDEIGTPFDITIDTQTLQDGTVTVRDRDSMLQERINSNQLKNYLQDKLS